MDRLLIDQDWTTQALGQLVRTPSITGSEEEVAEVTAGLAAETGAEVEMLSPDPKLIAEDPDFPGSEMERHSLPIVVARLGRPGGRRLLLQGHIDVVPPGDLGSWTVDPWASEIRDGRLYGRGACDMKGGVASILSALRAVVDSGLANELDGEVVGLFVPSEEDGGQGMLAAIRAGFTADAAVITEPSNLDVVIAHGGCITFRLSVPGRAAHAAKRREGISALDNLLLLCRALERDEAKRNAAETHPLMTAIGLPYPTIIGKVAGGQWASTVLDQVVAEGRYGVRLGQDWRQAEDELRACIADACQSDPFLRVHPAQVDITGGLFSSAEVPADHPLPVGLVNVAATVLGRRPEMVGVPYGADMRLLVNEGKTPTVIYGPGDVAVAHSADEFVPLDQVNDCARVLAAWVIDELAP